MLQIQNLNYSIGDRELLKNVEWTIRPGKKAALIGRNGVGKTTLLRILAGELEYDSGKMLHAKDYRIGYLPQEEKSEEVGPILSVVQRGNQELQQLEKDIQVIHKRLEDGEEANDALLNRLGNLEEQFTARGGYQMESSAKAILTGLGFNPAELENPMSTFSGGWRMRVHLARLLLQQPDLLLLDEPTNHLDLESMLWLEQYLKTFEGSMVFISHDRSFIDRLAEEIYELDRGRFTFYAGNYSFYEKKKAEDEELLLKRIEEQRIERERIQRFIDRFRYKASKAAQVQSRVKQLEKMEMLEIPPPVANISFNIQVETQSYKHVLSVKDLSFRYDEPWILQDVHIDLFRGEKVALVGINGAGKTTLTRLISGELQPQKGDVNIGERVALGYYAQHQIDSLRLDATIFEEVEETAADAHRPRLRDILGVFQLSGDDVKKPISVLSGGEKARVSLAKILLSPVNFLIMDEPTNHLDMQSQDALETALNAYDGTLLLISHDRYFLDKLVTRVIEIRDGGVSIFEGNYSDYYERRLKVDAQAAPAETAAVKTEKSDSAAVQKKSKEQKRLEAEARQAVSKKRSALKKEVETCETGIIHLEDEKADLEKQMADPETYQDAEKAKTLQKRHGQVQKELQETMVRWEEAQLKLEELLTELD
ncbi:MAG: ABC-F family ATP-binding cassette domain-containing protein [Calditrichia bacterium]